MTYLDSSALLKRYIHEDEHAQVAAALIAENTSLRSLYSIHLESARRVGEEEAMSFDRRQRSVARALGMRVLPAVRG